MVRKKKKRIETRRKRREGIHKKYDGKIFNWRIKIFW